MQFKLTGAQDMRAKVQARGAKFIIGDLGRYSTDPNFKAQMPKVLEGMTQAVRWYKAGRLKPVITEVVPLDAQALRQAFRSVSSGGE